MLAYHCPCWQPCGTSVRLRGSVSGLWVQASGASRRKQMVLWLAHLYSFVPNFLKTKDLRAVFSFRKQALTNDGRMFLLFPTLFFEMLLQVCTRNLCAWILQTCTFLNSKFFPVPMEKCNCNRRNFLLNRYLHVVNKGWESMGHV